MNEFNKGNNCFYLGEDEDNPQAIITWVNSGNNYIVIDHTEVAVSLRGQDIASRLVERVVRYARKNNLKVKATCSFAKLKLNRIHEYQDVTI